MKTVIVINNEVVGVGTVSQQGVSISSPVDGAAVYVVDPSVPVDVGYACALVDELPVFTAPAPTTPPPDPLAALIDIGPFFDRFGATKMAVLTSANPVVRAIVQDVTVRKWVDLTRDDVLQSVNYLLSQSLITEAVKLTVLAVPVSAAENAALRKVYFN